VRTFEFMHIKATGISTSAV